jgi:integrase
MSSLYKRGNRWWIQWCDRGQVHRKTTGIRVADDPRGQIAKQVQRDHDSARARGRAGLDGIRITPRQAADDWLATITHAGIKFRDDAGLRMAKWCDWLAARGVTWMDEITPVLIGQRVAERKAAGRSDATIIMEVDQLVGAAKLANRTGYRPTQWEGWPKPRRRQAARPERIGAYTADEVARLIEYFRERKEAGRWYHPVLLLAYLGCRWSELARLTVGDVLLHDTPPMVRIESRKTARAASTQHRWVEIHPAILPTMLELTAGRRPGNLLIENMPCQADVQSVLGRACRALGIQYRRIHGLRHYFISSLLAGGVPLASVMSMVGHRSLSTTQRYLTVERRQVGMIQALGGVCKSVPKK